MTTIADIYAAINPLPGMLTTKGKVKPEVSLVIEANAGFAITMNWDKRHAKYNFEREHKTFIGATFEEVLGKSISFINELPSADQAKLHEFMGALGKLIDAGNADGISVDFMNPLLGTMKRLSENVITYQPAAS
jgi:hypothetical protein